MKKIIFIISSLISSSLDAQIIEAIEADRPDQTETPAIVPKRMFQAEVGFTFQKEEKNFQTNNLPTVLWKYGINNKFELRLITDLISEKTINGKNTGFAPLSVGFKIKICDEKGFIPKTSLISHLSIPKISSSQYKAEFYAPEFRFTMQHTLSNEWSLGYNLGAEWSGFTAEPTLIYTLTTGRSITEKIGYYIELFGFAPQKNNPNHSLDGGITYLINNNFMLDLSSGYGITENAPDYYVALGFSFRI